MPAIPGGSLISNPSLRTLQGEASYVGCFMFAPSGRRIFVDESGMESWPSYLVQQIATTASVFQQQRTGHPPKSVTVVLSEDTLVITLHEALTPAEKALARTPQGAMQVQDYHRGLFNDSFASLRNEIERITGCRVGDAAAELEISTGNMVHAFTTGAMVQVFLLTPDALTASYPPGVTPQLLARSLRKELRVLPEIDEQEAVPRLD